MSSEIIFRPALYLGSLPFDADKFSRAAFVHNKLEALKTFSFFKPVMLCISTSGVKVCDTDCKVIYMAHALRRISYAACDPCFSRFAFLAREANSDAPSQYCHIFATETQSRAEELNAIIGDAFKLAYAKQRLQSNGGLPDTNSVVGLASLHPVELPPSEKDGGGSDDSPPPPLLIPPPPTTSPPPIDVPSSPPFKETNELISRCKDNSNGCNPPVTSSGLTRQKLDSADDAEASTKPDNPLNSEIQSPLVANGARQRAFSDPKVPPPEQQQLIQSIRHSVAFFESDSTPKRATESPAPSSPTPPIPTTPALAKNKHRAIFEFPLADHLSSNVAANPVVALKTHFDSLAAETKQPPKKPETPSMGAVSRFRLRQGVGGGKKRQLERPLSQIICHLDSALLLNNSPSFSVQPKSEERLPAVASMEPCPNKLATTVDEVNPDAVLREPSGQGVPASEFLSEDPPIPPLRLHSLRRGLGTNNFRLSSSEASSPSNHRGPTQDTAFTLQSLSESSAGEEEEEAAAIVEKGNAVTDDVLHRVYPLHHRHRLADVCPVPHIATYPTALASQTQWLSPDVTTGPLLPTPNSYPSHEGMPADPANGQPQQHYQQQTVSDWYPVDGGNRQSTRWTETPTPTATPTPTPTPAPLISQQQSTSPSWFQAYLPREMALELLTHEEVGSFVVRDSVTQPGCWALSVRVPAHINCLGITHYLIQDSRNGVKLKGLDKEWPSLEALITHLTVMPEMLPCPLRLPAPSTNPIDSVYSHHTLNPTFREVDGVAAGGILHVDGGEDEEYQRLSDFSSMLADMQSTGVSHHLR